MSAREQSAHSSPYVKLMSSDGGSVWFTDSTYKGPTRWLNISLDDLRTQLAAAGYHVVQEGQAVVDGRVWAFAQTGNDSLGRPVVLLRPLTDEASDG